MRHPAEAGERGSRGARRAGLLLGPTLFFGLLLWPGLPLTDAQRAVAGTTCLTAALWLTVALPIGATSLIPVALFPLLGVMPVGEAAPMYMRDLVLLFLGAFVIALGLERWGVHRRMALWLIAHVGGSRRRLVLGFMIAAAFLSMWISNTATTLLMLPIATAVIASVEGEQEGASPFAQALLLGVAYAASVGGMATLVGTAPNQIFLGQFADRFPEGPRISFGDWFLAWVPLVVIFVPMCWFLLTRLVFGVPAGGSQAGAAAAETIREERARLGPMSRPEVSMSVIFAATALLWVTRADLVLGELRIPGWSRLFLGPDAADPAWYRQHKNDIGDATVAVVMAILCFVVPAGRGRGEHLMDWRTASRLPWDVLLLFGAGFCIARGFNVSGLDHALGDLLSPLFQRHSSWWIVAGVCLFMSLLTEVTSNAATTAVLLPVLAAAGAAGGVNPLLVLLPATIAASAAFMLPVATPPNAVVFSSRKVSVPAMAKAGLGLNLAMVVLITVVFQLWVRPLLGIGDTVPEWALP